MKGREHASTRMTARGHGRTTPHRRKHERPVVGSIARLLVSAVLEQRLCGLVAAQRRRHHQRRQTVVVRLAVRVGAGLNDCHEHTTWPQLKSAADISEACTTRAANSSMRGVDVTAQHEEPCTCRQRVCGEDSTAPAAAAPPTPVGYPPPRSAAPSCRYTRSRTLLATRPAAAARSQRRARSTLPSSAASRPACATTRTGI
jgi:hypothetical protein